MPDKTWYRVRINFPFDVVVEGNDPDDAVKNAAKTFLIHDADFIVKPATDGDLKTASENKKVSPPTVAV